MKSLDVPMVTDADAWWDPEVDVPQTAVASTGSSTWLVDRPSVFATGHDEALMFAQTRNGTSGCGTISDFGQDDLFENVAMGYTALTLFEKRAVVVAGRVARLWPGEQRPSGYTASTMDAAGKPLEAGHHSLLWHSVGHALRWSTVVTDRPFVVAAIYSSQNWH